MQLKKIIMRDKVIGSTFWNADGDVQKPFLSYESTLDSIREYEYPRSQVEVEV
jgi:hypothetical protein